MIGRVALLVTFKKAKPKSQSLSRSHIRDLPHILKSSVKAILTGVFLISTTALFAQKKVAEYNHEDYITTIEQTCNRIKESHNIQWVYFRIANVDTTTYSDDSPPRRERDSNPRYLIELN